VTDDSFIGDVSVALIRSVNLLSGGSALPAAQALAHAVSTLGQQLMMLVMDTNHGGMPTFDEALNPDMLGPTLCPLLAPLTDALRRDLALGVANEQLMGAPISTMGGDLVGFLDHIPPLTPSAAASK